MENVVNTNGRRKIVPVKLRHFFKHEKKRRSFLILINYFKVMNSTAEKNYEKTL